MRETEAPRACVPPARGLATSQGGSWLVGFPLDIQLQSVPCGFHPLILTRVPAATGAGGTLHPGEAHAAASWNAEGACDRCAGCDGAATGPNSSQRRETAGRRLSPSAGGLDKARRPGRSGPNLWALLETLKEELRGQRARVPGGACSHSALQEGARARVLG